jgi:uncharacterized repeat protein (TIGR04138 family)
MAVSSLWPVEVQDSTPMRDGVSRARVSIARVMRWVACLAVVFAGARPDAPPLLALAAVLAGIFLGYDLTVFFFHNILDLRPMRIVLVGNRRTLLRTAMSAEELSRFEDTLHAGGFRLESALFLHSAFQALCDTPPLPGQDERVVEGSPGQHHITAAELCASLPSHAASLSGGTSHSASLLSSLGLRRGEDVGTLVFLMIDFGLVKRRPDDSLDDFRGMTLLGGPTPDT